MQIKLFFGVTLLTCIMRATLAAPFDRYTRDGNFFDNAAGVFNHAADDLGLDGIANLSSLSMKPGYTSYYFVS
ncbi:hypothetical protein MBANPS3_002938 [Mucor bainieri]